MISLQRSGYKSRHLTTDIALGITDGLDMSLWCYVYASIIFTGALSGFIPVGILAGLLGWVLTSIFVTLTSKDPLHVTNLDDQAVVIFGSISILMIAYMGEDVASSRGLATILMIIAMTSMAYALSCYVVGRYRLSQLLDLLPFPVVCGFMASIGWLLLNAGFEVAGDIHITPSLFSDLEEGSRVLRLSLAIIGGAVMLWILEKSDKFWTLPALLIFIIIAYYVAVFASGTSQQAQVASGWLFDITEPEGGVWGMLNVLRIGDIDWPFILSVVPQMLTVIFLSVMYTSMMITALKADSDENLSISQEFQNVGVGNIFCMASCAPPSYTDVVATSIYREFGASSRWMCLTSSCVGILVIIFGGSIINYLPKLMVSATIFLFSFQTFYNWLYRNARGFNSIDYCIVLIILGTVIFIGFMQGILIGIILTVLLFVIRYSMISSIESRRTLKDQRSSVERSNLSNSLLAKEGAKAVIYSLRGFLFFGSANSILDKIIEQESLQNDKCKAIMMDMRRVTGVDISALNTFAQIKNLCDSNNIILLYSGLPIHLQEKLVSVHAVSVVDEKPLIFGGSDFAIEYLEDRFLRESGLASENPSIDDILVELLGEKKKVKLLLNILERVECKKDEVLFDQGDADGGFYIVEQGSLSAFIRISYSNRKRIKKFTAGSLIGELSGYLKQKNRSATVIADENAILYRLSLEDRIRIESKNPELKACIHELVATVLAERVNFMNMRLMVDAD